MNALAKSKRAARRINTPAESKGGVANECAGQKSNGGAARGCAGEKMGIGICQPRQAMVAQRGDAPAKRSNTKSVGWRQMRRQTKRPNRRGMRRPNETTPNRWRLGGGCAGQTEQHQIGGGSAGNAPAKRNSTKSADRRRMRRPNERECGAAMRCTGRTATPNRWIGDKCAGKRKRMWRGDEMRRPNSNTKSVDRRRMRRQTKEDAARR